jgi:hypothetical protein
MPGCGNHQHPRLCPDYCLCRHILQALKGSSLCRVHTPTPQVMGLSHRAIISHWPSALALFSPFVLLSPSSQLTTLPVLSFSYCDFRRPSLLPYRTSDISTSMLGSPCKCCGNSHYSACNIRYLFSLTSLRTSELVAAEN